MINLFDKSWIQFLICHAASIKIFEYKYLGDLFESTGIPQIKLDPRNNFTRYLLLRELISINDFNYWRRTNDSKKSQNTENIYQYEEPIDPNSIWSVIMNDDVQKFVEYVDENNINIDTEFTSINGVFFLIDGFACQVGSLNILKYLIINGLELNPIISLYGIHSYSQEIIEFLVSQGISFDDTLVEAIKYHFNDTAKWIYENYSDQNFKITVCIESFNTEMFLYFIEDIHLPILKDDQNYYDSPMNSALSNHDDIIVKYLESIST